MSFDPKTDPAEIPENGERLNQTVKEVGVGKSYKEATGEKEEACIVKTVVDSGDRKGKTLSFPIFPEDITKMGEFHGVVGNDPHVDGFGDPTPEKMATVLKEAEGKRFEASVSRIPFETDSGKYIRYRQTFFTKPQTEAELEIDLEPTQFRRGT